MGLAVDEVASIGAKAPMRKDRVNPQAIVCLGVTAAESVLGQPDGDARDRGYGLFVDDLRQLLRTP